MHSCPHFFKKKFVILDQSYQSYVRSKKILLLVNLKKQKACCMFLFCVPSFSHLYYYFNLKHVTYGPKHVKKTITTYSFTLQWFFTQKKTLLFSYYCIGCNEHVTFYIFIKTLIQRVFLTCAWEQVKHTISIQGLTKKYIRIYIKVQTSVLLCGSLYTFDVLNLFL